MIKSLAFHLNDAIPINVIFFKFKMCFSIINSPLDLILFFSNANVNSLNRRRQHNKTIHPIFISSDLLIDVFFYSFCQLMITSFIYFLVYTHVCDVKLQKPLKYEPKTLKYEYLNSNRQLI